jgi:predicted PurR-regulated permease PerM
VLAVSLVYIALLVVISGAIVLMVPAIQSQVTQLADEIKSDLSAERLAALNESAVDLLRRLGFTAKDAQHIVTQISQQVPGWAGSLANNAVNFATTLVTSIMTILFDTALVFIISFYMMLDGERLVKSIIAKLPPRWEPDVRMFQRQVNETFGGFFRAQIIIALIYGLFTWMVLLGLGEPNGFLASLLAGLIMMIPFIGSFGAFVPPLLLGAKWGGVWGAFFAGPIVAVFAAVGETFYDRFTRKLPLFQPEEEPAEETPAEPVNTALISRNGDVAVAEGNGQHPAESATEPESATPRH